MSVTRVEFEIKAPLEAVFHTLADVRNFSKATNDILAIKFLSEQDSGVGCRFRETRDFDGKLFTYEFEITEYVKNERVRLVSEQEGIIRDTLFIVSKSSELAEGNSSTTHLTLELQTKSQNLLGRLTGNKGSAEAEAALRRDLELVKAYCESPAGQF